MITFHEYKIIKEYIRDYFHILNNKTDQDIIKDLRIIEKENPEWHYKICRDELNRCLE